MYRIAFEEPVVSTADAAVSAAVYEARALDFRVFSVTLAAAPSDVIAAKAGTIGVRWQPIGEWAGERNGEDGHSESTLLDF